MERIQYGVYRWENGDEQATWPEKQTTDVQKEWRPRNATRRQKRPTET